MTATSPLLLISFAALFVAQIQAKDFFVGYLGFHHFQKATPQPGVDFLERGAFFARQDKPTEARPFLEMAVKADPGNAMHHFNLARTFLILNFLEPAVFHYNCALILNPDHDQHEVSTANIGHISKILGVNIAEWNKQFSGMIKAYATGGGFRDGGFVDDQYEEEEDYDYDETEEDEEDLEKARNEL